MESPTFLAALEMPLIQYTQYTPSVEVRMAFALRPYRRFPVVCPVHIEHWFREEEGILWNLSTTGWRLSGDLPLEIGAVCSLSVMLPTNKRVSVAAGIVRWVRREEFGIETLVINGKAQAHLSDYIRQQTKAL
jgi:hypothetical protein